MSEKLDVKKVFICGATGFLGYYSALEFLNKGVKVAGMALPGEGILKADFWPKEIEVTEGYLFNFAKMNKDLTPEEKAKNISHEDKVKMFKGCDVMVYAVGPDDRVHSPAYATAYDYFYEKLVTEVADTFEAAKEAGVKKAVLLNSYFAYFDRAGIKKKAGSDEYIIEPSKNAEVPGPLAMRHPYIKVRVEQAKKMIEIGAGGLANGGMDVVVLELPYIFGNMPKRTPLWKDIFLDRFAKMPAVMFPKGGTNMIHVSGIAEAVVAASYYGQHGDRLPVGNEDRKYEYMINKMMEDIGATKRYLGVPCCLATIGGKMVAKGIKKEHMESGLNYHLLMHDIQSRDLYMAEAAAETRKHLHYDEFGYNGGGSLDDGIKKTVIACYPHRFDEKGNLIEKWIGVNPIKKETAENNKFVNKEKKN